MTTKTEILEAFRSLPLDEQREIIDELSDEERSPPVMTPELRAEFDRRWDEYTSGRVRGLTLDEVMEMSRTALERHG